MDIKNKNLTELNELCKQIRERILEVVSQNGGHLSSNMGAVELIVAMHYVFDPDSDPFFFKWSRIYTVFKQKFAYIIIFR